jgi:hypothetical protein
LLHRPGGSISASDIFLCIIIGLYVGFINYFRFFILWLGFGNYFVFAIQPAAQIYPLASLAAKRIKLFPPALLP